MKSMLVIGLGDYGHHLCKQLLRLKNEVMIIDCKEEAVDDVKDLVDGCIIADCTSRSVLEKVGVSNFDVCFVCIGSDFRNNLIIVNNLKELGAKFIISETDDVMLEKLLLNNGANEVIHPNKDSATRAAVRYSDEHIYDYVKLKAGYSIYEITPLREWINHSIIDLQIRTNYDTNILGINKKNGDVLIMPNPDTVIEESDKLMVLTHERNMEKLLKKM